jgi:cell division GTPase FtsZ
VDLGEESEAKSAPFVARVARQMGATVFGLVILPKVSDGAAKCAKAIETLQNLGTNTDAVYAYRSDIYSGISIGMMAYRVEAVDRLINLIKEARQNESETQNKNGDADSRKVEAN